MELKELNVVEDSFSYKESHWFGDKKFILAIRDEDSPDRDLIPLMYVEDSQVHGIDTYDMERILTTRNSYKPEVPALSDRFELNQLVKISDGNIIQNERWFEGSSYPKCITFHTNVYELNDSDIIEIFEGVIDESNGRVQIEELTIHYLITELYIEKKTPFFILEKDVLTGPFVPVKSIKKDSKGFLIVEKYNSQFTFGEYQYDETVYYEFHVNQLTRRVILPSQKKLRLIKERGFQTDLELITEFQQKMQAAGISKEVLEKILAGINSLTKTESLSLYLAKNKRIKKMLDDIDTATKADLDLISTLPETKIIREQIAILEDERSKLEREKVVLTKEGVELKKDKEQISLEVDKRSNLLKELKKELNDINETKENELAKIRKGFEADIQTLEKEKRELEESVQCIKLTDNYQKLEAKIDVRKEDLKRLEEQKSELSSTLQHLKDENLNAQKDGQKELFELLRQKKHFDFLSGRDLSLFDEDIKDENTNYKDCCVDSKHSNYIEFRQLVLDIFAKQGRKYDSHFVDNLLISLHQNSLTVLAGHPGVGKTSLARLLVKLLSPVGRHSEVSVHRGWTDQKDLIGFENPLNSQFQPSTTGLYEILAMLDNESKETFYDDISMAYILLDEANLSPMEHYWSSFSFLNDIKAYEGKFLKLKLGNTIEVKYPNNLRFIATINSDQTTEPLSPRILDRVNVIQIPFKEASTSNVPIEDFEHLKLSFANCREYFKLQDFDNNKLFFDLPDSTNEIYLSLKTLLFKELNLRISYRVDEAIRQYCYVANDVMNEEIRPLDYCFAQRVLPMINLQGDKAKKGLEKLLDEFKRNGMDVSVGVLENIIQLGSCDTFYEGNFNYFLTLSYAQSL